jgi:hypothetical protein
MQFTQYMRLSPLSRSGFPDNPRLDANGPDGRPTIDVLHLGTTLHNGDRTYWTEFHAGTERIDATQDATERMLRNFVAFVKVHARPCGRCYQAFIDAGIS